jgi:hypothetical protein
MEPKAIPSPVKTRRATIFNFVLTLAVICLFWYSLVVKWNSYWVAVSGLLLSLLALAVPFLQKTVLLLETMVAGYSAMTSVYSTILKSGLEAARKASEEKSVQ